MKTEISEVQIFNYEGAEKIMKKAFINSIFAFRNMLKLIFTLGYQIPIIDSVGSPGFVELENPSHRCIFYLQTGKTLGSFEVKFIIKPDGMINFTILVLKKSELDDTEMRWYELLDTPTVNEVRDKKFLYMAEFMPLIPKIALAMGGVERKKSN